MACLLAGWHCYKAPWLGLVLLGVALGFRYLFHDEQSAVMFGPVALYPQDLAALVLVEAALLRLWARPLASLNFALWVVLALGLVLMYSFGLGIVQSGLKPAGLDFRRYFTAYAPLLFGVSFLDLPDFQGHVRQGLVWMFAFLVVTAFVRWGLVATGVYVNPLWVTSATRGESVPMRVLASGPTKIGRAHV